METLLDTEPLGKRVVGAIRSGDLDELRRLLDEHPDLVSVRVTNSRDNALRSLLHIATDWPGHFPKVAETIAVLVAAGADVDAACVGPHSEAPLHWAASSGDVEALDALIQAGADLDVPGAVLGGGAPLSDAVGFKQWDAARRLVECGAQTELWHAAALGLTKRVEEELAANPPDQPRLDAAFWHACSGGKRETAELLLEHGANLDWLAPWEKQTPLDVAEQNSCTEVAAWLRSRGAQHAEPTN